MILAAVVLAAGASTRMGRAKALVPWRGQPWLVHCVRRAEGVAADPIVVVQGATDLSSVPRGPAGLVTNEGWSAGPLSSLQVGLRAVPQGLPVLVLTVDRPHLAAETVEALAAAATAEPNMVWQPRYGSKRGHPIVYPADLVQELLALEPSDTARTLLCRPQVQSRRRTIDVDDPAVVENLDRPEDLDRLPP